MPAFPSMMMHRRGGPALTVFASGNATASINGGGGAGTNSVSITRTGGLPPYTYAWTRVSGSAFAADTPTVSSTTFSIQLANGASAAATFRCTVTSADGQVASADVLVTASSNYAPLTAVLSTSSISASAPYTGSGELQGVYTPYVYVTITGGTGNYWVMWELLSGPPIQAKPANSWLTQFLAGFGASNISYTSVFHCVISDGANSLSTGPVTVTISST